MIVTVTLRVVKVVVKVTVVALRVLKVLLRREGTREVIIILVRSLNFIVVEFNIYLLNRIISNKLYRKLHTFLIDHYLLALDLETPKLEENEKKEEEWWSQFTEPEQFEDLRISAKLALLFSILKESEQIGDKVYVFFICQQSVFAL